MNNIDKNSLVKNDKHVEAFIQEATELLDILESSLLALENDKGNEELIGKIFRSLHTIKGAGGMFGFDVIAAFVHDIETVYDKIRNGELSVTDELIELTLKACDKLSLMINGENTSSSDDEKIISAFKEYLNEENNIKIKKEFIHDKNEKLSSGKAVFHIFFEPSEDLFLKGTRPIGLLNEISELGEALIIPATDKIPEFEVIIPEKLYISWNIFLSTDKGLNAIKDVFIFVEDDCKIDIAEIDKGELKGGAEFYLLLIDKKPAINSEQTVKQNIKNESISVKKENTANTELKIKKAANNSENISSIRVNSDKLDLLVNLVGELVTVQARLTELTNKNNHSDLITVAEDVERLTWELRENTLSIRMLPIGSTFSKFNRLVRDLSKELGKEVELIADGGETELDKNVIEKLNDPLVHIIRNCIDHGIEKPEERIKNGKLRTGSILLSAIHSGTHVLIVISDDGKGLDKDRIYKKALEKGLINADENLSKKDIYNLIFKPGFSTASTITNVSGRGVGLDVVRTAIEALRGSIDIESREGSGTTITLKLPLTLAIIKGLIVRIDKDFFVIPLSYVEECVELTTETNGKSSRRKLINVRSEIIPYIPLRERFQILSNKPSIEHIVVINENGMKTGLVVDEIIGEHQTVIKTLGKYYKNVEVLSGATVLGDGTVALIVDVPKLIQIELIEEKILINKNRR